MDLKRKEMESRIAQLMMEGFEVPSEKMIPEARLYEDLSLDSLDAVDMLVHLEENLGIKVDGEKFMHVRTLQDVYDVVWSVITEASSPAEATGAFILGTDQPELG